MFFSKYIVANKRIRKVSRTEIFRVLISSDRKCDAILEIVYSATVPLSLTKITASIKNEEILQLQRAAYVAIYSNNNYHVKYHIIPQARMRTWRAITIDDD